MLACVCNNQDIFYVYVSMYTRDECKTVMNYDTMYRDHMKIQTLKLLECLLTAKSLKRQALIKIHQEEKE
jgi:hypothetical protein